MINDVQRKPSFYVCKVNWGTTGGDLHSSKYDLTNAWESSPSKKTRLQEREAIDNSKYHPTPPPKRSLRFEVRYPKHFLMRT
ncbi:hypothetical protein, partial [Paenibacillus polymyxa]|uniref:hypothetical protein n=1 Tax=Paenibacillus polymyxa TaxID=1406 RepID=UPI0006C3A432